MEDVGTVLSLGLPFLMAMCVLFGYHAISAQLNKPKQSTELTRLRERNAELEQNASEAYQAVGMLIETIGADGDENVVRLQDILAYGKTQDGKDLLPFPLLSNVRAEKAETRITSLESTVMKQRDILAEIKQLMSAKFEDEDGDVDAMVRRNRAWHVADDALAALDAATAVDVNVATVTAYECGFEAAIDTAAKIFDDWPTLDVWRSQAAEAIRSLKRLK